MQADVLVRAGVVEALLRPGAQAPEHAEIGDASGCWVTPGLINGRTAHDGAAITAELGSERGFGRVLEARSSRQSKPAVHAQ